MWWRRRQAAARNAGQRPSRLPNRHGVRTRSVASLRRNPCVSFMLSMPMVAALAAALAWSPARVLSPCVLLGKMTRCRRGTANFRCGQATTRGTSERAPRSNSWVCISDSQLCVKSTKQPRLPEMKSAWWDTRISLPWLGVTRVSSGVSCVPCARAKLECPLMTNSR